MAIEVASPPKGKIENLTNVQDSKLEEYYREWLDIGLCTDPADRYAAGKAIHDLYAYAGLRPPNQIIWKGSPFALVTRGPVEPNDVAVAISGTATGTRNYGECIYGQHDAGWLSYYAFMREVVGLEEETKELLGLLALAKCAGWAAPYENVCYVSERHNVLNVDTEGNLHCLTGPAVSYPDGKSIYAVRGLVVPDEWIKNRDSLDPMLALTEPNLELRAAAASIIGWEKVLAKLSPVVIDTESSQDYDFGKLMRVDLPNDPGQLFLQVMCATGRTMVLRVPPTMRTAREANAWTYGYENEQVKEFNPEFRT